ncbi:MAG: alkyl/aryl-sulfatase [Pseudomonadota bacterium]
MLNNQAKQFQRRIVRVTNNVYTAVGFHGANTSMIIGDDGVIIVDTLMGPTSAATALKALRAFSDKPVKAVIYTHSHGDHTGGTRAFTGDKDIAVYALAGFGTEHGTDPALNPIMMRRGARQFGRRLLPAQMTNRGLAPANTYDRDRGTGFVEPTVLINDDVFKKGIAGVRFEIYRGPGETDDALFVWLPDERVLFTGDNFYSAFPNLYAIRGTGYRNVLNWSDSVAHMATFEPDAVVPGHTMPILGQKNATTALRDYSEAIRSVYDQTVAGINAGKSPDVLAHEVELPEHLRNKPYLIEFYGSVAHATRAIYAGLLGWYDGNPTTLSPLHPEQEAKRVAKLAGGVAGLSEAMQRAMDDEDYQWVLKLADHLQWLGGDADQELALLTKIQALRELAAREYNAPNRNYYLSYANELELNIDRSATKEDMQQQ